MKKTMTFAIAMLTVLLAVAYAAWTETATITVDAATGYIDLDFINGRWTLTATHVRYKDEITGSGPGNDGEPKLILTLENLYPHARLTYAVDLKNDGTLPVLVHDCNFRSVGGPFEFRDVDFSFEIRVDVDAYRRGRPPPFVLGPGESAYVVVYIDTLPNAAEGTKVTAEFSCKYKLTTGR